MGARQSGDTTPAGPEVEALMRAGREKRVNPPLPRPGAQVATLAEFGAEAAAGVDRGRAAPGQ
ncbi:hypothetical protein SAMN05421803_14915 [Nocardiopsis flavescens]|uniref:Uncharacterized protein n=1 Tax=Nocardiopsis flavescens TaxID=758803 RepID=A0A1M6WRR1_9ACTN|nr:hypothetical protein SAMN05421803_14915 [Nocardiopsis flavescens]